jgi:hypothetical protein
MGRESVLKGRRWVIDIGRDICRVDNMMRVLSPFFHFEIVRHVFQYEVGVFFVRGQGRVGILGIIWGWVGAMFHVVNSRAGFVVKISESFLLAFLEHRYTFECDCSSRIFFLLCVEGVK